MARPKKLKESTTVTTSPFGGSVSVNTVTKVGRTIENRTVKTTTYKGKTFESSISTYTNVDPKPLGFSLVLRYVIFFLLITMFVRVLSHVSADGTLSDFTNVPTFRSFLELITSVEPVKINFLNFQSTTLGDWGVFNFLRNFFASAVKTFDIVIFLFNGISIIVSYLLVLVRWLFL